MTGKNVKAKKASEMRYKRSALASMGYEAMWQELLDIQEACSDVRWYMEQGDETLLNALEEDEEAEWEFRMAFGDLDRQVEQLLSALAEYTVQEEYDDCTVALIGNRYNVIGYDSYEEDYYSLTGYEEALAQTEAGKRMMRHTKAEMLSIVGQCLGTLIAFLDIRQKYDYLKAAMDVLRDENTSLLKQIKEIDAAYEAAEKEGFQRIWEPEVRRFDALLEAIPDRMWIE